MFFLFLVAETSSSPSTWVLALLSGLIGTLVLLAAPALSKWIRRRRESAVLRREAKVLAETRARLALEGRVDTLEEVYEDLKGSMTRVLTFIEGTSDPFTGEMQGGLVKTLRKILDLVDQKEPKP